MWFDKGIIMSVVIYLILFYYFDFNSAASKNRTNVFLPLWNYDDQLSWPGKLCRQGGTRQSPINIQTSHVVEDFNKAFIKYGALQFNGYSRVLMTGINNGHTIQFSTDGDETMHPTITGGPLHYQYRLEQMHFHWLSEHALNGNKFPMEIHLVHVRADLAVSEALKEPDGLAILAIFCNVITTQDILKKLPSDEVMQYLSHLKEVGNRISGVIINIDKLISSNRFSYYTYLGSLTSPACNEAVIWILFDEPIAITDAHYRLFGKVEIGRHNFRSLQRPKQHVVYKPAGVRIQPPEIVKMFNDVFGVIGQWFRNATTFVSKGFKAG